MTDTDSTRDLLRRKVAAAKHAAIDTEGGLGIDDIEYVERLARLVAIEKDLMPRRRRRWPLAATFLGTLAVVSVLFFARVPETEVELDLIVDELAFTLPHWQVLTNLLNLNDIGISGIDAVMIPPMNPALPTTTQQTSTLRITAREIDGRRGELSLAALTPPSAARVWVRNSSSADRIDVSLQEESPRFQVDMRGPVEIRSSGYEVIYADWPNPKRVSVNGSGAVVDLSLGLSTGVQDVFRSQLHFENLSLQRIEEDNDGTRTHVRRESTVITGTLYFEALNGRARAIRPGEMLEFEQTTGWIRVIERRDAGLAIMLRMSAADIRTGWDGNSRSLMPTYFDWLRARHGLSLLWGTVLYLFSLAAGLLRWWGVKFE